MAPIMTAGLFSTSPKVAIPAGKKDFEPIGGTPDSGVGHDLLVKLWTGANPKPGPGNGSACHVADASFRPSGYFQCRPRPKPVRWPKVA